ncbi:MAG: SigE family RNA polymerase sigma factor [Kineosporiaceae bacterium]
MDEVIGTSVGAAATVAGRDAADDDFEAFVEARGGALVRVARGLLRDPHHAEDVVQDVLVKAHQHWAYIVARESPDAYVRRMLVNAATSFWRRAVRREHAVAVLPVTLGPDEAAAFDERDRMLAALRRLPPKQRAVLVLRHYEGLADADIARILRTSVATVRSNAHRGLANLRDQLATIDHLPQGGSR